MTEPLDHEFAGRTVLVTGATSGVGLAVARTFAGRGASVALVARGEAGLAAAEAACRELGGGSIVGVAVDLGVAEHAAGVIDVVAARLGGVDVLVNGAATMGTQPNGVEGLDADEWDAVFALNVRAPFLLARDAARLMIEQKRGGAIINISSSAAHRAHAPAAYASSKAALEGLTRTLAAELAPAEINVNAVAPGLTSSTTVLAKFGGLEAAEQAVRSGPLQNLFGRVSTPADIAGVVAFLASPGSRQITGQVVHVSAGNVV